MATGDKRIHQLTQIGNAPANGVLPIDVPNSEETNGITVDKLAKTMKCLQRDTLYHPSGEYSYYSKIAEINVANEGYENSLVILICGGNHYVAPASGSIISITVHRDDVYAAKKTLIGELEAGHVYQGSKLEIWIKKEPFSHFVDACVLSNKGNDVLVSGVNSIEPPSGYTII